MTIPSGLADRPIYLDYNATTPVDPVVTEAMLPFLTDGFGNPSSDHRYGSEPRDALQRAREQVAALIGASADGIVFTGSGSEADNLALRGYGPNTRSSGVGMSAGCWASCSDGSTAACRSTQVPVGGAVGLGPWRSLDASLRASLGDVSASVGRISGRWFGVTGARVARACGCMAARRQGQPAARRRRRSPRGCSALPRWSRALRR
ncbi:MAG: aminotransferase class V-fold PLP-dependent enzyme [Pseudonocardiaceae bacterium]